MKVGEENGKYAIMAKVRAQKVWQFSINEFGITLVILFQLLTLILGCRICGRKRGHKR